MVSEIIPVFSRKVLFGYEFMAAATAAIAFISLGVWAHHMFAVGMSRTADLFFVVSSLLISIPTGIKFFNWLATMYGGRISFASPMLFCLGFLSMFLIGGLTGIMLAAAPFDFQLHRHLLRGRPFPLRADRRHALRRLRRHPLLVSQGDGPDALRAAGPLAVLAAVHRLHPDLRADAHFGLLGMPRRIYTYDADRGWAMLNQLTTLGAIIQAPSFVIFLYNMFWSLRNGRPAGDDPWDAWTLEWATTVAAALVQL